MRRSKPSSRASKRPANLTKSPSSRSPENSSPSSTPCSAIAPPGTRNWSKKELDGTWLLHGCASFTLDLFGELVTTMLRDGDITVSGKTRLQRQPDNFLA